MSSKTTAILGMILCLGLSILGIVFVRKSELKLTNGED